MLLIDDRQFGLLDSLAHACREIVQAFDGLRESMFQEKPASWREYCLSPSIFCNHINGRCPHDTDPLREEAIHAVSALMAYEAGEDIPDTDNGSVSDDEFDQMTSALLQEYGVIDIDSTFASK